MSMQVDRVNKDRIFWSGNYRNPNSREYLLLEDESNYAVRNENTIHNKAPSTSLFIPLLRLIKNFFFCENIFTPKIRIKAVLVRLNLLSLYTLVLQGEFFKKVFFWPWAFLTFSFGINLPSYLLDVDGISFWLSVFSAFYLIGKGTCF